MSRLCRLRTKTHGEDGQWAYEEITKLREQVAAQAAEIARLKTVPMKYRRMQFNAELQEEVARLREQVKAQAAVIEKLREALRTLIALEMADAGARDSDELCCEYQDAIRSYNAIPTDSTQILAEVRKKERERVEKMLLGELFDSTLRRNLISKIREME